MDINSLKVDASENLPKFTAWKKFLCESSCESFLFHRAVRKILSAKVLLSYQSFAQLTIAQ